MHPFRGDDSSDEEGAPASPAEEEPENATAALGSKCALQGLQSSRGPNSMDLRGISGQQLSEPLGVGSEP